MITEFTPLSAAIGGALLGLGAGGLMLTLGHIAGFSGITQETIPPWPKGEDNRWRLGFVLGAIISPLIYLAAMGSYPPLEFPTSPPLLLAAGLLIGFGASFGRGCTSGHGLGGLARISRRSFVAVSLFIIWGAITVYVLRHVIGGA
jgi:uncharacterized membrane protein YedE/YeeE